MKSKNRNNNLMGLNDTTEKYLKAAANSKNYTMDDNCDAFQSVILVKIF